MSATIIYPPFWASNSAEIESSQTDNEPEGDLAEAPAIDENREGLLDMVDQLRHLVATGKVNDLVVVGRGESGAILTEVHRLSEGTDALFSLIGALDTIKVELCDLATYSPEMMIDGSEDDPWQENEE